jgi:excisionase family DNA binding protein
MLVKLMEAKKTDTTRRELSTQEASQMSGLSLNHLAYLLRQGKLEGHRFGQRMWVIYADSLENYLATPHKSGPKGPRKATSKPDEHSNDFSERKK